MNICVLFGAGAEAQFRLMKGGDFAKSVLGLEGKDKYNEAIRKFYSNMCNDYWYPNYYKVEEFDKDKLYEAAQKKKLMSEDVEGFSTKKDFDKEIKQQLSVLSEHDKEKLLNDYTSYMGILDERFYTLISPKVLGPKKFWSVITCYWRAYLSLATCLMENDNVGWIMDNPVKSYGKMCEKAREYREDPSYYKIIREHHKNSKIHVITTNYTPLCSTITELCDKELIAYVNGSFRWFEQARELKILDVTKEDDFSKKDYFPFIFLQSGVKPIVGSVQIEEWHKAISFLKEAERLIIVGYRANCDDNHLNSIIREYILKGKEVIYLLFDDSNNNHDYEEEWLFKSFRLADRLKNVRIEHICKDTAFEIFEEYINGTK